MLVQEMKYPVGTKVLVWRLEEEAPQLLALCREAGIPVEDLEELPAKRQREKAAERLLLCHAFGRPVTLLHDGQGAPSLQEIEERISITHTMKLVALAWNEDCIIGLDAEQDDRSQVVKVRNKFLNTSEQQFIQPSNLTAHIVAWTAKEAVIKAERNSAIDWTDGITVEPFEALAGETSFFARCGDRRYCLITRCAEGHYITVAVPVMP